MGRGGNQDPVEELDGVVGVGGQASDSGGESCTDNGLSLVDGCVVLVVILALGLELDGAVFGSVVVRVALVGNPGTFTGDGPFIGSAREVGVGDLDNLGRGWSRSRCGCAGGSSSG